MDLINLKKLLLFLIKPLEWHVFVIAFFCIAWLYISMILSPAFLLTLIGALLFHYFFTDMPLEALYIIAVVGAIYGVFWAEKTRRNMGVLTFHSYLLSTPEIDGWRNGKGERIDKK